MSFKQFAQYYLANRNIGKKKLARSIAQSFPLVASQKRAQTTQVSDNNNNRKHNGVGFFIILKKL